MYVCDEFNHVILLRFLSHSHFIKYFPRLMEEVFLCNQTWPNNENCFFILTLCQPSILQAIFFYIITVGILIGLYTHDIPNYKIPWTTFKITTSIKIINFLYFVLNCSQEKRSGQKWFLSLFLRHSSVSNKYKLFHIKMH